MIKRIGFLFFFLLFCSQAMAYTVVDDFNRSNRALTVDGWGQVEGSCVIESGAMGGTTTSSENLCYTPDTYNADMAAFVTISTKPEATASGLSLFVRFNSATYSGYDLQFTTTAGDDRLRLFLFNNGSFGSQLGSTYYVEVSAGDQFGIVAQGTSLKCYYKPVGGSWSLIIDVTDSTYTSGGRIAFGAYSSVGRYDDLVGGNDLEYEVTAPAGATSFGGSGSTAFGGSGSTTLTH